MQSTKYVDRIALVAMFSTLVAIPLLGLAPCDARAAGAGDASRGKDLYETSCSVCHSPDKNRVGPAHRGVFGRRAGMAPGYSYSEAVAASSLVWNEDTLSRWLANPEKLIPGQKMGVSVADAAERQDLIAYLKTLSAK